MSASRLLIHCNAGGDFGMGHLMRCVGLIEEAVARGWQVTCGGDLDQTAMDVLLARAPAAVISRVPVAQAPEWLQHQADSWQPTVVHLDSYWLPANAVPRGGHVVSVLQDGAFGVTPADLAIDPNLGAQERFTGPPVSANYLLGSDVVPIRRQVLAQLAEPRPSPTPAHVLVVIGGTDPFGLTTTVVAALDSVTQELRVRVVAPVDQRAAVDRLAAHSRHAVEVLGFVNDLPALARRQHLVVSAAGTSAWDFACLGIPTALLCVADNQEQSYQAAVAAGFAIGLGRPERDEVAGEVQRIGELLADPDALARMAQLGTKTFDGLGTWRIVGAWEQLAAGPRKPATGVQELDGRPARTADAELLFAWRNDPETRKASRHSDEVPWEQHMSWLSATLDRPDRRLFVVLAGETPVGTVRCDHHGGRDWEVSITLAPEARGKRLALPVLRAGERALVEPGPLRLLASVHTDNGASRRLFESAGYLPHLPADSTGFATTARWRVSPA